MKASLTLGTKLFQSFDKESLFVICPRVFNLLGPFFLLLARLSGTQNVLCTLLIILDNYVERVLERELFVEFVEVFFGD